MKTPFYSPRFSPYGRYTDGIKGTPESWAESFKERMSPEKIQEILGDNNPYFILGLRPGASPLEIKSAFYKRAMETHPDRNPTKNGDEFRKVRAAYEKLIF